MDLPNQKETNFLVLVGRLDGQIVLLHSGRQYEILQAHGARILDLCYDSELNVLYSIGEDDMIKIWHLQFQFELIEDREKKGKCKLLIPRFTLFHSLKLSGKIGDKLSCSKGSFNFSVSMKNNHIKFLKCNENGISEYVKKQKSSDQKHEGTITGICYIKSLECFATSGLDGIVKFWDIYGSGPIRELNFGSSVYSLSFANDRGDLLVGIQDQICLVQIQDYLPLEYLNSLVTMELDFQDDNEEPQSSFDPNIDFWHIYKTRLGATDKNWHCSTKYHLITRI